MCRSTGANTGRTRASNQPEDTGRLPALLQPRVSVIHPAIHPRLSGSCRARSGEGRKGGKRNRSHRCSTRGAPKAPKLQRRARGRLAANARRPRPGFLQIRRFLLFSHELCDLEQITVVLWASLCSLRNGNCIKKELLGCFSLKNKAKQQSQRGNGHRSGEAKRVQSWRGVLVLVFP